jgi:hypothetical protein
LEVAPDGRPDRRTRRKLYQLRDKLRPFQWQRQRDCGARRIDRLNPQITASGGRAHMVGVLRCGNVHTCPTCRATIAGVRRDEVKRAVEWHGHEGVRMVTLTLRHGMGDDLRQLRRGLANAWRKFASGAPWLRAKAEWGLVGSIRALEVTYGRNGFHPHLHVLLLVRDGAAVDRSTEWIVTRWQNCVRDTLGPSHVPDDEHGAELTRCNAKAGDYITKLGLEVSDGGTKAGRAGRLSVWQLGRKAARLRGQQATDDAAPQAWREFVRGIRGARQLTWSRGLKKAAGIEERSDQEITQADPPGRSVTEIAAETWELIKRIRGVQIAILEGAERRGAAGVEAAIGQALATADRLADRRRLDGYRATFPIRAGKGPDDQRTNPTPVVPIARGESVHVGSDHAAPPKELRTARIRPLRDLQGPRALRAIWAHSQRARGLRHLLARRAAPVRVH